MSLTIGNWILFGFILIMGIMAAITIYNSSDCGIFTPVLIIIITILLIVASMFGLSWYHKNVASGARAYKDYQSNLNNGIDRTIDIYAEDGRLIYHYEGKCDVEDNTNYILFEDENGKRVIIYYGVTDTVIIKEK